jgi:hypothetical protein
MYSDDLVKHMLKSGTYAWVVAKNNQACKLVRIKLRAMGKDAVSQIKCVRTHSYRAGAIGLLSGLIFLQHAEWKGHVEWHIDSLSVICNWKRLQVRTELGETKERGVWMRLWRQKAHWKGRLKIYWVKAHADTFKRESTEDEKSNHTVVKLAEDAYHKLEHTPVGENEIFMTRAPSTRWGWGYTYKGYA